MLTGSIFRGADEPPTAQEIKDRDCGDAQTNYVFLLLVVYLIDVVISAFAASTVRQPAAYILTQRSLTHGFFAC